MSRGKLLVWGLCVTIKWYFPEGSSRTWGWLPRRKFPRTSLYASRFKTQRTHKSCRIKRTTKMCSSAPYQRSADPHRKLFFATPTQANAFWVSMPRAFSQMTLLVLLPTPTKDEGAFRIASFLVVTECFGGELTLHAVLGETLANFSLSRDNAILLWYQNTFKRLALMQERYHQPRDLFDGIFGHQMEHRYSGKKKPASIQTKSIRIAPSHSLFCV